MTTTVNLMLGIHSHQPVGNFEGVFRDAYESCYKPFLETLARHPGVRASLHYSGPLLEWFEENAPDYIDAIASLVERGQVEILSGGFYEPILPIIPREDAIGQLLMMNDYINRRFGQEPRGLWLTERVWEPHLPSIIAEAGLEYTIIDETHFAHAGLKPDEMFGYYLTEDDGRPVAVFPIDKNLRYKIPFAPVDEAMDYLRSISSGGGVRGITYGDDGEKFGVWPDTYEWVYTDGYLDRLFSALEENSDWIAMPTFSEFIDDNPPVGRIYLPTASYDEMMEWAQPSDVATEFHDIVEGLKEKGTYADYRQFVRGGFWRNFLAKYPEANRMHKKMTLVSRKVDAMEEGGRAAEARRELWRGQCNCPYWHGLFGGLYLNYLRCANYSHILKAEIMADEDAYGKDSGIRVERMDYDCDGHEEILISTPDYNFIVNPGCGGAISEIDFKPKCFNITDVMSRRPEAYHRKLKEASSDTGNEGAEAKSIHDIVRVKEEGLEKALIYDSHDRLSFIDRFLPPDATLEDFAAGRIPEADGFVGMSYNVAGEKTVGDKLTLTLARDGLVSVGVDPDTRRVPVSLRKEFGFGISSGGGIESIADGGIRAVYNIQADLEGGAAALFGVELNVTLLAGDAEDRYYEIPGVAFEDKRLGSTGAVADVSLVRLIDHWMGIAIVIECEPAATLWRFPIETVSQSEGGFEKTYQGSCVVPVWPISLGSGAGEFAEKFSVSLRVELL